MSKYLKRYKWMITVSVILSIIQVWATLYQPTLTSNVIKALQEINVDGVVSSNDNLVYSTGLLVVIVGIIGLVAGLVNTIIASNISLKVGKQIRSDAFEKIQTYSFLDIEKFSVPHLIVRLTNDVIKIESLIMTVLQMLIRIPFMFIGAFVLSIIAIPKLWWSVIVFIISVIILNGILLKLVMHRFKKIQNSIDNMNSVIKENVEGVRVVKSFVAEKTEIKKYDNEVDVFVNNLEKVGLAFSFLMPAFTIIANIIVVLAIFLVSNWAIETPELIGEIVAFVTYISQMMFTVVMAGFLMQQASRAIVSIQRINEILKTDTTISYGKEKLVNLENIEFKNVSFKYNEIDDYVLKDINFSVNKGEKIGIIGASGCGKSTLVQLIPRLFDVNKGKILINGINIKDFDEESLRDNIAIILQKANLFSGTIKENILQGNKNANMEELIRASEIAQAAEFINNKEENFETEVYQKGSNFSGGQKQRISIARGIIKNPSLLIFDDSTSALDAKSENLVKEAIYGKLKDTTTIIVSQKISSIVETNKIIVLNNGRIEAIGNHKELLKISELYKEIYDSQKSNIGGQYE